MALDEVMLRLAKRPTLRLYEWISREITFGYPQKQIDVVRDAGDRNVTRRCTGGGIVEHGSDLTIALAVPATHPFSKLSPEKTYRDIHATILAALDLPSARLARKEDCSRGLSCFQHPACFDIIDGTRKICGGAQRRSRDGFLYQGSLHVWPADFAHRFPTILSQAVADWNPPPEWEALRDELVRERYGNPRWNSRR